MTACPAYEALVLDRASGDLAPGDAARLDAHLETCPACRAELAAYAETLALARLPGPSAEERAALAGLADRALATLRAAERRQGLVRRTTFAVAAAAAAVVFLLAPAALRDPRSPRVDATAEAWQAPEATALWDDAGVVEEGSASAQAPSSSTEETWNDVALAAFDDVEGISNTQ